MTSFIDNDGNELDYSGKDFAITKQVISFYDFKIVANKSVNVKITNNAHNREVFGYKSDMQIGSVIRKAFNIYKNGNKADSGFLVITSVDQEDIELFFITGNANWFSLWDFNCNEIVTTKFDVLYQLLGPGPYGIRETWKATQGVVFPLVDFSTRGEMHDNQVAIHMFVGENVSDIGTTIPEIRGLVPCLYIHTLLKLLANHSGTNITGNLFSDQFFLTIIITPDNMERWDTSDLLLENKVVKPEHIAPKIKAVAFIKWVAMTFGCLVTFDNEANSISLDMIDKIDKSSAADWSAYYVSHETRISKHNNKVSLFY